MPVRFYPPEFKNVVQHMDYREEIENAGTYALKHELQAVLMFARAFGVEDQFYVGNNPRYKLPSALPNIRFHILFPYTIHKFMAYQYYPNHKS